MERLEPTSAKKVKLVEQINASTTNTARHLLTLPPEVQENILSLLDDEGLLSAELTCLEWRRIIAGPHIFKRKCARQLHKHPHLASTFRRHGFQANCERSGWCKQFYFGMRRSHRWPHHPVRTLVKDCLKAEADGDTVDLSSSEEWGRMHNYSGVYDMVYDRKAGRLFCSVFDTIQVLNPLSIVISFSTFNGFNPLFQGVGCGQLALPQDPDVCFPGRPRQELKDDLLPRRG